MKPYRNQKLLDFAIDFPICTRCLEENDGTIVACHSNSIEDGHGEGQKAHDLPAYMCHKCHIYTDTHWKECKEEYYHAVYLSTVLLLSMGKLVVK